jgi:2-polyprenyl-3-methyl-5-hydroxy-6-metoxy-1,4-benzoquinol methylase
MSRKTPDFAQRPDLAEFPELMDQPCSRDEMRACLRDLARVNRWFRAYPPTLDWLESLKLRGRGTIRILDVGCGYGDTLRRVEQWTKARGIAVELMGLDLHPDITAIAAEATPATSGIQWMTGDVFDCPVDKPVDVVICSLFTHHLTNADVVRFLRWMEEHARVGWFVNDLSRAPIPYHLFGWFARVMRLHLFVQHDGPTSIARAFRTEDWRRLCAEAGLRADEYRLLPYQPARLCVSRKK